MKFTTHFVRVRGEVHSIHDDTWSRNLKPTRISWLPLPHVTGVSFLISCSTCRSGRLNVLVWIGRPMDLDAHPINLWDTQIGCGFVVASHVRLVLKRLVCWDISSPKLTVRPEKRPSETGNFIFQLPTIIFSSGTLFFLRECILFCSMDVFPGERWAWYYKTPIPRQQLYLVDSSGIFPANERW